MKKTKRILSVVLALILIMGCIPISVNASISPTAPAKSGSGAWSHSSNSDKINSSITYTEYGFMQTEDVQVFRFVPAFFIQKYAGAAYAVFNSLKLYTDTLADNDVKITDDGSNPTSDFLNTYAPTFNWTANSTTANAGNITTFPNDGETDNGGFPLAGTVVDVAGCQRYYWDCTIDFNSDLTGKTGSYDTGFYWNLAWTYAATSIASKSNAYARIGVKLSVTDVRALIEKVNEANETLNNPTGLSETFINDLKAAVDAVPAGMLDGTTYYTQAEVDEAFKVIDSLDDNYADYTAYQKVYNKASSLTNDGGAYTADSFAAFTSKIQEIDANLPKNLSSENQTAVNTAINDIKSAYSLLIGNNLGDGSTTELRDSGLTNADKVKIEVGLTSNSYKFMQIRDDEQFTFSQKIHYRRFGGNDGKLSGLWFDTDYVSDNCADDNCVIANPGVENKTNEFLSMLTSETVVSNNHTQLNNWVYDSSVANAGDTSIVSGGVIKSDSKLGKDVLGNYGTYDADSLVVFKGLDANTTGSFSTNYVYRTDYSYQNALFGGWTNMHAHLTTTIDITDARALAALCDNVDEFLADAEECEKYTASSVNALTEARNAVPSNMTDGSQYYEQTVVDEALAALNASNSALEFDADYTAYDEMKSQADAIIADNNSNGAYLPSAFEAFKEGVLNTDNALDRDLGTSNQATVDAATEKIKNLLSTLTANEYCDYSALDAAKDLAQHEIDNNSEKYTAATLAAVTEALNNANSIADNLTLGENGENQTMIDNAAKALVDTINGLKEIADYTAYESAKADADAVNNDDGSYSDEAFESYKAAVEAVDNALDKDLENTAENRSIIEGAVAALEEAKAALEEKKFCDYTALDKAIADASILDNSDGKYTDASWSELENALSAANNIEKNMVVGSDGTAQKSIDDAAAALNSALDAIKNKADYSEYNDAKALADAVTNADNSYAPEAFEAYKEAVKTLDDALNKDLEATAENQAIIDSAKKSLDDAKNALEENKYCDYTALDEALADAKTIDNTDKKYTDATYNALKDAIDAAESAVRPVVVGNSTAAQDAVDALTKSITDAKAALADKADYSEYDSKKASADALTNEDGRYDSDAFDAYKEAVENIDSKLNKDLTDTIINQQIIDAAKAALDAAKGTLELSKNYFVSFYDENGELIKKETVKSVLFGSLVTPKLPENTDTTVYVGWKLSDGTLINQAFSIASDISLYVASEAKKLIPKADSNVTIDAAAGFVKGITAAENTVSGILEHFENDETVVEIKSFAGTLLSGMEQVGTGSTITLKSKFTGVIYETRTIIIKGDVNGDGVIDADDVNIAKNIGLGFTSYTDEQQCFSLANDMFEDGTLDVLDMYQIKMAMQA